MIKEFLRNYLKDDKELSKQKELDEKIKELDEILQKKKNEKIKADWIKALKQINNMREWKKIANADGRETYYSPRMDWESKLYTQKKNTSYILVVDKITTYEASFIFSNEHAITGWNTSIDGALEDFIDNFLSSNLPPVIKKACRVTDYAVFVLEESKTVLQLE